jgi:hypothetical protein
MPKNFHLHFCKENLCSIEMYHKYVKNYRIYLFLRVYRNDHFYTPSQEVDIVWHLHQNFSQHYKNITTKLLGSKLSHIPSKGGEKELTRHHAQYDNTIATIKEIFLEEPDPYFWPPWDMCLGFNANFKWHTSHRPKPRISKNKWITLSPSFLLSLGLFTLILSIFISWYFMHSPAEMVSFDTGGD